MKCMTGGARHIRIRQPRGTSNIGLSFAGVPKCRRFTSYRGRNDGPPSLREAKFRRDYRPRARRARPHADTSRDVLIEDREDQQILQVTFGFDSPAPGAFSLDDAERPAAVSFSMPRGRLGALMTRPSAAARGGANRKRGVDAARSCPKRTYRREEKL